MTSGGIRTSMYWQAYTVYSHAQKTHNQHFYRGQKRKGECEEGGRRGVRTANSQVFVRRRVFYFICKKNKGFVYSSGPWLMGKVSCKLLGCELGTRTYTQFQLVTNFKSEQVTIVQNGHFKQLPSINQQLPS